MGGSGRPPNPPRLRADVKSALRRVPLHEPIDRARVTAVVAAALARRCPQLGELVERRCGGHPAFQHDALVAGASLADRVSDERGRVGHDCLHDPVQRARLLADVAARLTRGDLHGLANFCEASLHPARRQVCFPCDAPHAQARVQDRGDDEQGGIGRRHARIVGRVPTARNRKSLSLFGATSPLPFGECRAASARRADRPRSRTAAATSASA